MKIKNLLIIIMFVIASQTYAGTQPAALIPSNLQVKESDELIVVQTEFQNTKIDTVAPSSTDMIVHSIESFNFTPINETALEAEATLTISHEKANQIKVFEAPALSSRILAYPSPMKFSAGEGKITYRLNNNMKITMKIYDIQGNLVYDHEYNTGSNGGKNDYNDPAFTINEVGQPLSAGVYIVLLFNEGTLIGKSKMAIIP